MKIEYLFVRISLPKWAYYRFSRKFIHKRLAKKMAWEILEYMRTDDYYDDATGRVLVDGKLKVVVDESEE